MKWNDMRGATLGGTICSIWVSFSLDGILQTALVAALGTLISFITSRLLDKWCKRK